MRIDPFSVQIHDDELNDLRRRLADARWPDQIPGTGWNYGADTSYIRDLAKYWSAEFDWRRAERQLNRFPQFTTTIDGQLVHFVHVKSPYAGARPLLLLHGWPSTPFEFYKVIDALVDPMAHGGSSSEAFDVIIPSLPGFAWSGPTTETGWHPGRVADAFNLLMQELGYANYSVHGGDFGAVVASQMARRHGDSVDALHLTFLTTAGRIAEDGPATDEEASLEVEQEAYNATETGYLVLQSTKPQTLSVGLNDSPIGLAAWIIEKYQCWTDNGGNLESVLTKDELLTTVATYWFTRTIGSSCRLYFETGAAGQLGPSPERVEVPTHVAVFPRELYRTSRRVAARHYNVHSWSEQPRGGHFAAAEQPQLLVVDLRKTLGSGSHWPTGDADTVQGDA